MGIIEDLKKEQQIRKAARQRGQFLAKKARQKRIYQETVAYEKRGGLMGDVKRMAEKAIKQAGKTKPKYEMGSGPI